MDDTRIRSAARIGAYTTIGGSLTMIVGAVLWGLSGTDLWSALDSGDMAGYLAATGEVKGLLVANTTFWTIGVLILGVAGAALVEMCKRQNALTMAAMVCFRTAIPMAIIAFITMLGVVVQIAPDSSATAVSIAKLVGWIGARSDDIATALIVAAGPLFISLAGRGDWVPNWLVRLGYVAGACGVFSLAILYFPGMSQFGFIIVISGLAWMISSGIVLLRLSRSVS